MKSESLHQAPIDLENIIDHLARQLSPKRIWLFGSRAAKNAKSHSDFDLALENGNASFREFRKAKEHVNQMAGIYTVDLIELEKADSKFAKMVKKNGKVLYEK